MSVQDAQDAQTKTRRSEQYTDTRSKPHTHTSRCPVMRWSRLRRCRITWNRR